MATVDLGAGQAPTDQDDAITGTARNDSIAARAGNDLVTAGGGNDAIDGGPGIDTAAYSGAYASYRVTAGRGPGDWAVQDQRNGRPDGSDALAGVERLRFADRTVLLRDDAGPVAAADAASMDEDGAAILLDVLANDRDGDGDPLAITGFRDVVGGTVSVVGGKAQFVPAPDFSGTAGFTYTAQQDLGPLPVYTLQGAPVAPKTAEASVAVTVRAVNDAPRAAATNVVATDEDTASAAVPIGATDVDSATLTYALKAGTGPAKGAVAFYQGAGSFVYTPEANANGADTFTVLISDGDKTTEQVVSAAVRAVNDPHTGTAVVSGTAKEGQILSATNTLADVDGLGALHYQWQALTGTTWSNIGADSATYTPTVADVGKTLRVVASFADGGGTLETEASAPTAAVIFSNRPPVLNPDSASGQEDTPIVIAASTLLGNDTDPDGDTLTIASVGDASGGTVALSQDGQTITFTPAVNFNGAARLTYTARDAALEAESTVGLVIAPVNDPHSGAVSVAGTSAVGEVLTASNTLADADVLGTLHYQWQASTGITWSNIGADSATYTLTAAEADKSVRVVASFTDGGGTLETEASAPTAAVHVPTDHFQLPSSGGTVGMWHNSGQYFGGRGPVVAFTGPSIEERGILEFYTINAPDRVSAAKLFIDPVTGDSLDAGSPNTLLIYAYNSDGIISPQQDYSAGRLVAMTTLTYEQTVGTNAIEILLDRDVINDILAQPDHRLGFNFRLVPELGDDNRLVIAGYDSDSLGRNRLDLIF